jgi:hypothetical protein
MEPVVFLDRRSLKDCTEFERVVIVLRYIIALSASGWLQRCIRIWDDVPPDHDA